jgi:hypothetical protein
MNAAKGAFIKENTPTQHKKADEKKKKKLPP